MTMQNSDYPSAKYPEKVGKYDACVKSGGGYFFDEVLEYRVWVHPENGGEDLKDGNDYFYAFVTYEDALAFSQKTKGAEIPLVLLRQIEWVDEPQPGKYIHKKSERITEWQPQWLPGSQRKDSSIAEFLKEKSSDTPPS